MKNQLKFFVIFAFLVGGLLFSINILPVRADNEPNNNSFSGAESIGEGSRVGAINPAGDEDYYSINMFPGNRLVVNLSGLSMDLNLELYTSNYALLETSTNTGTADEFISVVNSSMFNCYIKVFGATGIEVSSYSLMVILDPWADFEPNDDFSNLFQVGLSQVPSVKNYGGEINPVADVDYIYVAIPSYARANVTLWNMTADLSLELYNYGQTLLCGSYNAGLANESILVQSSPNSFVMGISFPYYLKIFGATGSETSDYDLYFNGLPWIDFEPNDDIVQATTIPEPTTYFLPFPSSPGPYIMVSNGEINQTTDQDYYKIYLYQNATLQVNVSNLAGDLNLQMYDASGTPLVTSANGGISNEQITYVGVPEGWYYLRVYPATTDLSPYQISFSTWLELEPNNDFAAACMIEEGRYPGATINPIGDVDMYQVPVLAGCKLQVKFWSTGYLYVEIYSPSLLLMNGSYQNSTGPFYLSCSAEVSGSHFLKVYGANTSFTGTYKMDVCVVRATSLLEWGVVPGDRIYIKQIVTTPSIGMIVSFAKWIVKGYTSYPHLKQEFVMASQYSASSGVNYWSPGMLSDPDWHSPLNGGNTTWQNLGGGKMGYPCYLASPIILGMGAGSPLILPFIGGGINMTWFNASFNMVAESTGIFPPDISVNCSGNSLIVTNTTTQEVFLQLSYTPNGILERMWQYSSGTSMEMSILRSPTISVISPPANLEFNAGAKIPLRIVTDGGEGLGLVKYLWSTTLAEPDWNSEGIPLLSPYEVEVPAGQNGTLYLHVYAQSALDPTNSTCFVISRVNAPPTSVIPGFPAEILLVAGFAGIGLLSRRLGKRRRIVSFLPM